MRSDEASPGKAVGVTWHELCGAVLSIGVALALIALDPPGSFIEFHMFLGSQICLVTTVLCRLLGEKPPDIPLTWRVLRCRTPDRLELALAMGGMSWSVNGNVWTGLITGTAVFLESIPIFWSIDGEVARSVRKEEAAQSSGTSANAP